MNSIKEKEETTSLIEKVLVVFLMLAIGILFCFNVSAAVSITLGVILCVYGFINLIIIVIGRRPLFSVMGILNSVFIAIGIAFCVHDLASVIVLLIPFILTIVGALLLTDGFVCFFSRKQGGKARFIGFFFFGAAMFSLGLCLLCVEDFRIGYSQLVFGLMLCIASSFMSAVTVINRKKQKKQV